MVPSCCTTLLSPVLVVTLLLVATCSYPAFLVALAFGPASSRLQQWGNVLWLSVHHRPPVIHPASSSLQRWGGGAQVLLGIRLSLGRSSPCRCCPLVHPVPAIVVLPLSSWSSPLSSPCPCRCCPHVLAVVTLCPWPFHPGPRLCCCHLVLGPGFLSSSLSSYLPWVVVSSSG